MLRVPRVYLVGVLLLGACAGCRNASANQVEVLLKEASPLLANAQSQVEHYTSALGDLEQGLVQVRENATLVGAELAEQTEAIKQVTVAREGLGALQQAVRALQAQAPDPAGRMTRQQLKAARESLLSHAQAVDQAVTVMQARNQAARDALTNAETAWASWQAAHQHEVIAATHQQEDRTREEIKAARDAVQRAEQEAQSRREREGREREAQERQLHRHDPHL